MQGIVILSEGGIFTRRNSNNNTRSVIMSFSRMWLNIKITFRNLLGISSLTALQGDRPGFPMKLGASSTMANPGNGWMRLGNIGSVDSGDITTFAMSVNTLSPVVDMSNVMAAAKVGTYDQDKSTC